MGSSRFTAVCAAATERGRATVIGSTVPGKSTAPRTGMMTTASAGSGGNSAAPAPKAAFASLGMGLPEFAQDEGEAAIVEVVPRQLKAAARQRDASLEAALRNFQPMNRRGALQRGCRPLAGDDENAALDSDLEPGGRHPRERGDDGKLVLVLEDVDGRLPDRSAAGFAKAEELAMQ